MLEKALVNLSFDDGRQDNYTIAAPLLKKYNLPATFNITTAYVKGDHSGSMPCDAPAMTMDMVKQLAAEPLFEIAGHGYFHNNEERNILKGIDVLNQTFGTSSLTPQGNGFASPGTGLRDDVWHRLKAEGVSYARVSLRYLRHARIKTLLRKISRVLKHPRFLYRLAYEDTLMDGISDDVIYSIPVLANITVPQIEALINYAIRKKKACVLMLHSIAPNGQVPDNWYFEAGKFERLLQWLSTKQKKGALEVTTSMNIYQKLKERDV